MCAPSTRSSTHAPTARLRGWHASKARCRSRTRSIASTSCTAWGCAYDKSVRIIKEDARKAGIELVLEPIDRQVYMDRQSKTKEYEMFFVQWGAIIVIYDSFYNLFGKEAFLNYSGFQDADLEKWAKDAKESATIAESIKPMEEAQKVVVSQIPTLAVYVPNLIFVANTKFDGYLSYPSSNNGAISLTSLLNLKPKK